MPKNVVIDEPLESLFIQDGASDEHFFKHVLIVADEHSEFSLSGTFPQTTKEQVAKSSGNIIVGSHQAKLVPKSTNIQVKHPSRRQR